MSALSFKMAAKDDETMSCHSTEKGSSSSEMEVESEGRRMQCFRAVMKKCVDKILAAGSQGKFGSCFAEVKAQNPAAFKAITEQLMQHLRTNIEEEFDVMIKQEDQVYFHNELDQIVAASDIGDSPQPAWRPSGKPEKDTIDHIMQVKLAYREKLKHKLQELNSEGKRLEEDVLTKRKQLSESEQRLDDKFQDLKETAEYVEEIDIKCFQEQAVLLNSGLKT